MANVWDTGMIQKQVSSGYLFPFYLFIYYLFIYFWVIFGAWEGVF